MFSSGELHRVFQLEWSISKIRVLLVLQPNYRCSRGLGVTWAPALAGEGKPDAEAAAFLLGKLDELLTSFFEIGKINSIRALLLAYLFFFLE